MAIKKILLVHLYSNGDCLYATAVARQIKLDYPDCHLTWAISNLCSNIILGNPYVDEVLEISTVKKNDVAAFRKLKKEVNAWKRVGRYDEVFITHNADINQAYYDGSIRSSVLKAYPYPITVSLQPVLFLSDAEKINAEKFAEVHQLKKYEQVVLFEFAPQSGQSNMNKEAAILIAEKIAAAGNNVVILSSANKINHNNHAIIDGSLLSFRETAHLTHYCTLLLGSSSGITWISTSNAAKQLPMIQLLNPNTNWANPISRDFERFGFSADQLIELTNYEPNFVATVTLESIADFAKAKSTYHQLIPMHFRTTKSIVYNLLCYLEFDAIKTHIKVNKAVYGNQVAFYKEVLMGFVIFPFRLCKNIFIKGMKNKLS